MNIEYVEIQKKFSAHVSTNKLERTLKLIAFRIRLERPDAFIKLKYHDPDVPVGFSSRPHYVIKEIPRLLKIFPVFWKSRTLIEVKITSRETTDAVGSYNFSILDNFIFRGGASLFTVAKREVLEA